MQPLDVGYFKPLKLNWAHAVDAFRVPNVGQTVTKPVFARIFKPAWIDSIKARSIVNRLPDQVCTLLTSLRQSQL